ncbi:acyltransferase family protein [Changpingibacter yushuensis]|uniref:acyltransferase family protein n=1 Tax=Changpingibacter yushuensis TaxID=2758440 RepID=UPI00165E4793|nr:acyltransferase [Changpingibacter yushuensis]
MSPARTGDIPTKSRRNSRIEMLRVLAMAAIVLHHYSVHGGLIPATGNSIQLALVAGAGALGKWGVDVFVLISSWFLTSKEPTARHFVKFHVQVWTTSVLILIFFLVAQPESVGTKNLVRSLAPILTNEYWFATSYWVLMLLSPLLNLLIARVGKENFSKLLVTTGVIWVVIPTFGLRSGPFVESTGLFVFLYLVAAFLRSRGTPKSPGRWGLAACVSAIALVLSSVALQLLSPYISLAGEHPNAFTAASSALTVFCAFSTVRATLGRRSAHWRVINTVASAAFGVYLIHDNPMVVRILWTEIVGTHDILGRGTAFTMLHIFVSVAGVYAGCTLIELVRLQLIQRPSEYLLMRTIGIRKWLPVERLKSSASRSFDQCVCWLDNYQETSAQE